MSTSAIAVAKKSSKSIKPTEAIMMDARGMGQNRMRNQNPLVGTNLLSEVFPLATNPLGTSAKPLVVDPKVIPLPGLGVSWKHKEPKRRVARQDNA